MQILHWLFNRASQEPPTTVVSNSTEKQCKVNEEGKTKAKDVIISLRSEAKNGRRNVNSCKINCDDLVIFRFIQRKDVSRSFFYHTLNLKCLGSFEKNRKPPLQRSEDHILRGTKVLPIVDSSHSSSTNNNTRVSNNTNKKRTSRMKDLLKWVATAKNNMNSKKGAVSKVEVDDDLVSNESPKISFRIEKDGNYSTTTTTTTKITTVYTQYSTLRLDDKVQLQYTDTSSCDAGIWNWITTDSEFVVLEL